MIIVFLEGQIISLEFGINVIFDGKDLDIFKILNLSFRDVLYYFNQTSHGMMSVVDIKISSQSQEAFSRT